jgi:hypothetical protein
VADRLLISVKVVDARVFYRGSERAASDFGSGCTTRVQKGFLR